MSTGPAEGPRARSGVVRAALAALLSLLLLGPLAACTDDPPPAPRTDVAVGIQDEIARTLEQRGKAIAERNEERFLASIVPEPSEFVAAQGVYFDNIAQLPVGEIGFEMDTPTLVEDDGHYWAEVLMTLELAGYDAHPVVTRDRYRFTQSDDGARYLLSSTTDANWEASRGVQQLPWDLGPIRVARDSGVLGIFDDQTIDVAENVLDAASFGRFDVAREVPDAGLVDVVVYATSDLRFLDHLPGLPVSDPQQLDALTIPVMTDASRSGSPVASYRIMVHPRILTEDLSLLDRLMRHELTHVALGERADGAPLWLSEGIAEWVSVQPVARDDRRLPADALRLARSGLDALPRDEAFSGRGARAWYGVSWWICEYVASTYDRSYLWHLLDRLADGDETEAVVEELMGITTEELVRSSMRMMRRQYEPEPTPTPTPTPTPPEQTPPSPLGVTESATTAPSPSP